MGESRFPIYTHHYLIMIILENLLHLSGRSSFVLFIISLFIFVLFFILFCFIIFLYFDWLDVY